MIIYARSAFTVSFLLIIQSFDITEIIIRPNQHNIFRKPQPSFIDIKHFFIGNKNLRDRVKRRIYMLLQNASLVSNDLLYQADFFIFGNTYKSGVMNTTHSNRINVLIWGILGNPSVEYLIDSSFVSYIIPFSHCFFIPLRYIIKE